jgi:chemotaxis response regulator CheB
MSAEQPPDSGDTKHSVLICADSTEIRDSIRVLLATTVKFAVVGEAVDGADCLQQIRSISPDVLILDIKPAHGGTDVA